MTPPVSSTANGSQRPTGPKRNSRKFKLETNKSWSGCSYPSFAEPDDYFSPKKKSTRSTEYTSPLSFTNEEETLRKLSQFDYTPLTRENLENLAALQEGESSPPKDYTFDNPAFLAFMRKSKSRSPEKKKPDKKKSKEEDIHPLNLPPEELRRLSARMAAKDEKRASTQTDKDVDMTDADVQSSVNGTSSQPSTPGLSAPGAFPSSEPQTNGDSREEHEKSPTPPPHRIQPTKVDPEACKAAGNKFFKAKDYDRAIIEYSKAVDADPKNATYLSNRAAAYMSANKLNQALTDIMQASGLEPSNEKILLRLARIYTSLGRPQDALDIYARLPSVSAADSAAAKKALQSIEMAEREIEKEDGDVKMALWGIDQAKQTLGNGSQMPRKWQLMRARANLKLGTSNALGEVQAITQSLTRDNPVDAQAIALAGRAFYLKDEKGVAKSDYQRAEECFRKALSLDPDMTEARNCLRTMKKLERARNEANDLYKQGKWEQASNAYTEALTIDSSNRITNAKILGNRALARMKLQQFDEARSDCDQALRLDPTYAKAKRTRAKCVGEAGDWDQAVKDLKALAEENPTDNDLQKELRNAELELKKSKRKDWYKILGVSKDASEKDIEKAYKKKAAVLHPDKTQGDKEKEELFKDCLEAKETLLDPQKRHMYDSGADLMEPGMGMGGGFPGGFGGMGGMGGMGGGVQIDPEMLFNMMGGMGGGRGGGGMGGGFPGGFTFSTGGGGGGRGGFPF